VLLGKLIGIAVSTMAAAGVRCQVKIELIRRQPKIAVRCVDTEELEALAAQARSRNLCARTIQDAYVYSYLFDWVDSL